MKNGSTTKTAARAEGKQARGKAKEAGASAAGGGTANGGPFITIEPRATEAAIADPSNERGELVCTSETGLDEGRLLELYRYLQLTRLVEEKLVASCPSERNTPPTTFVCR